jgi:integrase
MARLGSIKYQISNIINSHNGIGVSKKEQRANSGLKSLENGHNVSDKIHSYKSIENLRNDLTNLANFSKENFGIKDITQISASNVRAWIESKQITYNTASNYLSELNKVAEHFSFSKEEMKALREDLKAKLTNKTPETRAYKQLEKITLRENSQVAFELQRDYGLRINAATNINIEKQLKDNTLIYREKGGKLSQKELNASLTSKIIKNAVNGKYEINKRTYSREIKKEIEKTGQKFNGSHGIRHAYAQKNIEEKKQSEVSHELGHSRTEILKVYLR